MRQKQWISVITGCMIAAALTACGENTSERKAADLSLQTVEEASQAVGNATGESALSVSAAEDGFLRIEGGSFLMGSPESERQRGEDEVQHEVTISPFYADPYEVRQSDYEAVMGVNPSHFRARICRWKM